MASDTDIVNRALAAIGTRTTIASFLEPSNEAKQANLLYIPLRDELLRLAPWNCCTTYNVLQFISAAPGTPENPSQSPSLWNKSLPAPPWAYEYAYPTDCLRDLFIIPQFQTGFASGVPITTAITGGIPNFWSGPPVRHKVIVDQPTIVSSAAIAAAGTNYAVGDNITTALGNGTGVPCILTVSSIGAGGSVTGVSVSMTGNYITQPTNPVTQSSTTGSGSGATFNLSFAVSAVSATVANGGANFAVGDTIFFGASSPSSTAVTLQLVVNTIGVGGAVATVTVSVGGVYNGVQANPVAPSGTTGVGTGATFNITYAPGYDQKVILTSQENAILAYCRRVVDPNQWDAQFVQAMTAALAARLAIPVTGSEVKAKQKLAEANSYIQMARVSDANEGLTINDVTPDFIRVRGIDFSFDPSWGGPLNNFDWGPLLTIY